MALSGIAIGTNVVVRTCAPGGGPGLYEADEYLGTLTAEDEFSYTLSNVRVVNLAQRAARSNIERVHTSFPQNLLKTAVASIATA